MALAYAPLVPRFFPPFCFLVRYLLTPDGSLAFSLFQSLADVDPCNEDSADPSSEKAKGPREFLAEDDEEEGVEEEEDTWGKS